MGWVARHGQRLSAPRIESFRKVRGETELQGIRRNARRRVARAKMLNTYGTDLWKWKRRAARRAGRPLPSPPAEIAVRVRCSGTHHTVLLRARGPACLLDHREYRTFLSATRALDAMGQKDAALSYENPKERQKRMRARSGCIKMLEALKYTSGLYEGHKGHTWRNGLGWYMALRSSLAMERMARRRVRPEDHPARPGGRWSRKLGREPRIWDVTIPRGPYMIAPLGKSIGRYRSKPKRKKGGKP